MATFASAKYSAGLKRYLLSGAKIAVVKALSGSNVPIKGKGSLDMNRKPQNIKQGIS